MLPFLWWMWSNVINIHLADDPMVWSSIVNSVLVVMQQIGCLAVAVPRSALVQVHVAEPLHNLHSPSPWPFICEPIGWWQWWPGKGDWYLRNGLAYPLDYLSPPLRSPFGKHSHGRHYHILFLFKEVYPYTSSPVSSSSIFQLHFFQVHPAKLGHNLRIG